MIETYSSLCGNDSVCDKSLLRSELRSSDVTYVPVLDILLSPDNSSCHRSYLPLKETLSGPYIHQTFCFHHIPSDHKHLQSGQGSLSPMLDTSGWYTGNHPPASALVLPAPCLFLSLYQILEDFLILICQPSSCSFFSINHILWYLLEKMHVLFAIFFSDSSHFFVDR